MIELKGKHLLNTFSVVPFKKKKRWQILGIKYQLFNVGKLLEQEVFSFAGFVRGESSITKMCTENKSKKRAHEFEPSCKSQNQNQ